MEVFRHVRKSLRGTLQKTKLPCLKSNILLVQHNFFRRTKLYYQHYIITNTHQTTLSRHHLQLLKIFFCSSTALLNRKWYHSHHTEKTVHQQLLIFSSAPTHQRYQQQPGLQLKNPLTQLNKRISHILPTVPSSLVVSAFITQH